MGVPDPITLHELALRLGKTVQEMTSGEPGMSAHELCVGWPLYWSYVNRREKREREQAEARRGRV